MEESSEGRNRGTPLACAACKLLRRRCMQDCVFAPYFPASEPHKFTNVHKVFGASNVNKMLQELPEDQRANTVSSLVYEADARLRDPVNGCVGEITALQSQLADKIAEVERLQVLLEAEKSNRSPSSSAQSNSRVPH